MNYFKYTLILCLAISIVGCCATKTTTNKDTAMAEAPEAPEVVINTTEETPNIETPEHNENTNQVEIIETPLPIETVTTSVDNTIRARVNHDVWNELLQKHVSDQGNVNYKGFKTDNTKFYGYLNVLSETPPQDSWSKDETLAYWMNVYNAFTIKLILDNYPVQSIKDIKGPWNHRFIKIGDKWYTLNDVEHRIIRKMDEPRIHFALVCAAVSCPRLYNKAFTEANLETDLEALTREFLNDTSKNELSENSIKLSKIFKWYGGDFKTNGNNLIDFLNQYSEVKISRNAKKSYKDYNWDLNE
ncbi:DUF547 domain-containing protein [Psychroserpens sp. MEBiC05023]